MFYRGKPGSKTFAIVGVLGALLAGPVGAAEVWNEATDGDLGTDPLAPTAIAFALGSNTVSGTVTTAGGDRHDFFTFSLGPTEVLSSVTLVSYLDVSDPGNPQPGNTGFYSIDEGATSTDPVSSSAGLLGGDHLVAGDVGTDILDDIAGGGIVPNAPGFDLPVGPGTYTFLVQQTGPQVSAYELDFEVAAVPLPAALPMLVGGLLVLGAARRRRADKGRRDSA